jgi:ABC-type Na+ efflux pump permease subunit
LQTNGSIFGWVAIRSLTSKGVSLKITGRGMTFLPIVERELRVAARRRGTYGLRTKIAGAAALAFAGCLVASRLDPSISFVKTLFWGLSGLCLAYSLAAGRLMTADCLSNEKREGTLGLLFLTDLKGYDVVLGKLAATSLDGFYGLLAVFPMLAIPLLAGGMTSGEFWRMALLLVNTFLFSLAIGLFVSALCRDERKAMAANFALLLCLAALPPAIVGLLAWAFPAFTTRSGWFYSLASFAPSFRPPVLTLRQGWFYSCPVYSFLQCSDARYKVTPKDFWWSVGVTFVLTLFLLLLACRFAPRSWQDQPISVRSLRQKSGRRPRWWREGNMQKAAAFRKRLLDLNPYFWLAGRPYLKVSFVWTAVALIGCAWFSTTLSIGSITEEANIAFALLLNFMLKMWITVEAGRSLASDKKSGAFELLLSTPLTVRDILRGQTLALRRQFLKPLALVVILELLLLASVHDGQDTAQARWVYLAFILLLVADAVTLGWAGMLAALTAKSYGRATLKTAASVLVLPWFLFGGGELAIRLFTFLFRRRDWDPDWPFDLGCWFGAGIFADLLFLLKARWRLQTNFRRLALEPFARKRRFAWLRDWRTGSPERKAALRAQLRRKAAVAAAFLLTGTALVLYDIHAARTQLPKPLVISIAQSNNPVRIFGGEESFQDGFHFILPDGTLWTWGRQGVIAPPQPFGTNHDWLQVTEYAQSFASPRENFGLRANGTLWNWPAASNNPAQFGSDRDWAEFCAGAGFCVARKRDGTLWAWGDNSEYQLGNGSGPNRPNPVQVGTNHDWTAVNAAGPSATQVVAMRADGTLWTWGRVSYSLNGVGYSTNHPVPIQLCRESNWVAFGDKMENGVRNQAGEWWSLTTVTGFPSPIVPIAAIGRLLSSNTAAVAFGPLFTTNWTYAQYELQTNGTLWATPKAWPYAPAFVAPSQRVGHRSDWIKVWGSYQTMFGLTADGTLWTWGSDFGQESHWTQVFVERVGVIRNIIRYFLGSTPPIFSGYMSDQCPPQKDPRPLLRLIPTNPAPPRSR